jgi:hypothetical protein
MAGPARGGITREPLNPFWSREEKSYNIYVSLQSYATKEKRKKINSKNLPTILNKSSDDDDDDDQRRKIILLFHVG